MARKRAKHCMNVSLLLTKELQKGKDKHKPNKWSSPDAAHIRRHQRNPNAISWASTPSSLEPLLELKVHGHSCQRAPSETVEAGIVSLHDLFYLLEKPPEKEVDHLLSHWRGYV